MTPLTKTVRRVTQEIYGYGRSGRLYGSRPAVEWLYFDGEKVTLSPVGDAPADVDVLGAGQ